MQLNIFIVLFLTLFTGGHSLKCYSCRDTSGSCSTQTTCSMNDTTCASATVVGTLDGNTVTTKFKDCYSPQACGNGSLNLGVLKSAVSMQCCNTDLCNSQDVPDYDTHDVNGKQCYSCDEKSCFSILNCLGTEDYCITGTENMTSLPVTLKGCASKSVCDATSQATGRFSYSCCQGNLCNNAKSITQRRVLPWPFF
ncbi:CD59 glycoprotein-like [Triplophysa rosa]|uniref:CD59 glycoprotein-like n=1 Tax=Triplophysa rosa TaxID=992332 RepID=UPI002545E85F|nr:CD59 glycoprotein-like [Triplophysa rosa]